MLNHAAPGLFQMGLRRLPVMIGKPGRPVCRCIFQKLLKHGLYCKNIHEGKSSLQDITIVESVVASE